MHAKRPPALNKRLTLTPHPKTIISKGARNVVKHPSVCAALRSCSFWEIGLNEHVMDLLCPTSSKMDVRENPDQGPYIDGLTQPYTRNGKQTPKQPALRLVRYMARAAASSGHGPGQDSSSIDRTSTQPHSPNGGRAALSVCTLRPYLITYAYGN
jgi:hypothetical protein